MNEGIPNITNKEDFLNQENKKKFDKIQVGDTATYKASESNEINPDCEVVSKDESNMTVDLKIKISISSSYTITATMDQVLDAYKPKE